VVSGANFLLDVIPYRHPEAAQILGGRYTALCQALVLTSENDFGTMYRPGFALALVTESLSPEHLAFPVRRGAVRRAARHIGQLARRSQIAGNADGVLHYGE
jgi:hypothetical protein